ENRGIAGNLEDSEPGVFGQRSDRRFLFRYSWMPNVGDAIELWINDPRLDEPVREILLCERCTETLGKYWLADDLGGGNLLKVRPSMRDLARHIGRQLADCSKPRL